MALPIHAVLTDPDNGEEHDIEVRHTDSFLRVRAEDAPSRPRNARERSDAAGSTGSS
jgi:hypothetical protein